MAVPLLAIGIPMAMNIARVIGQQGLKQAIKRYGPQAAKMVNKNMNKLRKRFPEILGPQKKARMDPTRSKMVKDKFMDDKGKFYSDKAAKDLQAKAATNRRALAAGASIVAAGPLLLSGNEDKDTSVVKAASAGGRSGASPMKPLEKRELPTPSVDKLKPGAVTAARRDRMKKEMADEAEKARRQKAADRRSEKDKGPRAVRTESKKPGRFSEEAGKEFFGRLGIRATYDDDERQAAEDRGEGGNRRKGGLFTRRGPIYTKGKKAKL